MCHHDFELLSETNTKEILFCIICGEEIEQEKAGEGDESMVKKGDIFTAYPKGCPPENLMAVMNYQKGVLLCCVNSDGEQVYVAPDEIGEILGNIDSLN